MSAKRSLLIGFSTVVTILLLSFATRQLLAQPATAPANQQASEVSVCTWSGCKPAAVSYSQDDAGNLNGSNNCQAQLEAAGFRGTFYYDGNTTQPWMAVLSAAGHEIGSHLTSHNQNCTMPPSCFPNCTPQSLWQTPYTPADITAFRQNQIEPNLAAIEAGTGQPVVSMAYPCGSTDAARMTAAQSYFVGARGYYDPWDSNFPWIYDINPATPTEFMNLNADTYFSPALVDKAIAQGGWHVAAIHDYCEGINYLSSQRNNLWVAPVGEVLKYIRVRNATQFSNYLRAGQTISFDAVHTLGDLQRQKVDGTPLTPIIYDDPVTLRIHILDTDQVLSVEVNGTSAAFTVQTINGSRYVLLDTPVNYTRHVVLELSSSPTTATPTPTTSLTPTATPTGTFIPPTATPTAGSVICPCSLWDTSVVPAVPAVGDTDAVEVGVQFRANVDGYITGLRFYKGNTNTGTHVGHLWTSSGTLLATATFINETASGWQTVYFASPVAVTANTTYVASYQAPAGHFAVTRSYFNTAYSHGPLSAPASGGVTPGNGVYVYPSGFPNQSYEASNYWVDVIFDTTAPVATATPTPTATPNETLVPPTSTPTSTSTPEPTATSTNTPLPPTATPTPGPVICPCSLWDTSVVPAVPAVGDTDAVEVGVQFRANVDGYITGLRFYKGNTNTGTHVGHLWTSSGTLLATATFINETASGWQTVYFASPVAVTANTTYVASYQAPAGHFAVTRSYFNTAYSHGPLSAPASGGVTPGNGVYVYPSGFPNQSYEASNYWVDVIFDTTAPVATATPTPTATPSQTPVPPTSTPTNTWTPGPTATPTATATATATPTNTPVPPTATATNTPTPTNTPPATPACPCSLWDTSVVPAVPAVGDADAVELGVQFRTSVNGYITGLRFYKSATNTGIHVGNLWTSTGTLLATAIFTNESASGWQTVTFATPVPVTANTGYVASYQTTVGHFAVDRHYFNNAGYSNNHLYAFRTNEVTGGNGVYRYPSGFPNASYQASNYWVDVIFTP